MCISRQRRQFSHAVDAADFKMGAWLLLLAFNAFVIIGVHFVTKPDQLMGFVGDSIRLLPEWIHKPLVSCPPCMSSVWGSAVWWTMGFTYLPLSPRDRFWYWSFYILALCGFVRFLNLLLEATRKEAYEAPPEE